LKQYIELVERILSSGVEQGDRTGTGTISVFGGRIEFDLRESFPLVTVKETRYKTAFLEMLWFLRGDRTTEYLNTHGSKLWDAWTPEGKGGWVGPIYGSQWRNWNSTGIDQIAELIRSIKYNPNGRRHIVNAWNVSDLSGMALPPCHRDFQCNVQGEYLDLMVAQRSWDIALGAPFNIAQYALLTHLIARATNLKPRILSFNYGNAHLYLDHVEPMREVIKLPVIECKPVIKFLTENIDIDGYSPNDFEIQGYESHPFVKLKVSV
jgi:thymidylate synthase